MEEAAQVLEIETFVPLALQNPDPTVPGGCRLKRVVLIGDHHQLPPVVKNPAFQKYGKLDQSLFARLVRLGVPTVQLDAQGRARPGIAKLYSWRYNNLGNLPAVTGTVAGATAPGSSSAAAVRAAEYCLPNPGFAHEFQFVNVGDFQGAGESVPTPHFFQNLGEAEFVVATYMYMRLCGYPAAKISILTTYNGQKHLIRDVLQVSAMATVGAVEAAAALPAASFSAAEREFLLTLATAEPTRFCYPQHRCAPYTAFGMPACVTTVDRFQGQQNDFILLSLVRTRSIGHLRDPRRLVVAMSRARLGLYVFGRQALFENCYELLPAFSQLLSRPVQLQLSLGEVWKPARVGDAAPVQRGSLHEVSDATTMGVLVHQLVQAQQKQ
jgi:intron-binding protein aquarius